MRRAYVGNIPFEATEEMLRYWFSPYKLVSVEIIHDKTTGRPKGFAFVEFETPEAHDKAVAWRNGQEMSGRTIVVNDATERRRM